MGSVQTKTLNTATETAKKEPARHINAPYDIQVCVYTDNQQQLLKVIYGHSDKLFKIPYFKENAVINCQTGFFELNITIEFSFASYLLDAIMIIIRYYHNDNVDTDDVNSNSAKYILQCIKRFGITDYQIIKNFPCAEMSYNHYQKTNPKLAQKKFSEFINSATHKHTLIISNYGGDDNDGPICIMEAPKCCIIVLKYCEYKEKFYSVTVQNDKYTRKYILNDNVLNNSFMLYVLAENITD